MAASAARNSEWLLLEAVEGATAPEPLPPEPCRLFRRDSTPAPPEARAAGEDAVRCEHALTRALVAPLLVLASTLGALPWSVESAPAPAARHSAARRRAPASWRPTTPPTTI